MKIKFWGVRGSIPSPPLNVEIRSKIEKALKLALNQGLTENGIDDFLDKLPLSITGLVGGNTPCLEITTGEDILIFDAGTGIRNLGDSLTPRPNMDLFDQILNANYPDGLPRDSSFLPNSEPVLNLNLVLFLTHTHWDHIQGFPFFSPAYDSTTKIDIYGYDAEKIQQAMNKQQSSPSLFPITMDQLKANISFHTFPKEGLSQGPFTITSLPLPHPGGSLAYRVQEGQHSMVLATDYEFIDNKPATLEIRDKLAEFLTGTDVFVCDTQYTYLENVAKEGWGHSNSLSMVELAVQAGVSKFLLFHHDPTHNDAKLYDTLEKTLAYNNLLHSTSTIEIALATEGTELVL